MPPPGLPTERWYRTWALRTGSTDAVLLARTRDAADGMTSGPRRDSLDTMSAGRMRRAPFSGQIPEASAPGSVTHVDAFQISRNDLPQQATAGARRSRRGN